MKMNVSLFLTIIAFCAAAVAAQTDPMLKSFSWQDCGVSGSAVVKVTKLEVTSPLNIPGQVQVTLDAEVTGEIPCESVLKFAVFANTSIGNGGTQLTIPCVEGQGSCAYLLKDVLNVAPETSAVTQQLITILRQPRCPVAPANVTVSNATVTIPDMHGSILDALINTNNYYVTAWLSSPHLPSQNATVLGCLYLAMPVEKACLGWLCPQSLEDGLKFWQQPTSHRP